jgi:hypothetical protein
MQQDDQNILFDPQGEQTETPAASPAETITTGEENPVNPQGAEQTNPEEVEWNSLSGPAQERFRAAIKRANEAERRVALAEEQFRVSAIPQASSESIPRLLRAQAVQPLKTRIQRLDKLSKNYPSSE